MSEKKNSWQKDEQRALIRRPGFHYMYAFLFFFTFFLKNPFSAVLFWPGPQEEGNLCHGNTSSGFMHIEPVQLLVPDTFNRLHDCPSVKFYHS